MYNDSIIISDCERGFSAMKRIKNETRNRMAEITLNSLMVVSIEGPPISQVDFKKIARQWHDIRHRRIVF